MKKRNFIQEKSQVTRIEKLFLYQYGNVVLKKYTYPAARGESSHRRIMLPIFGKARKLERVDMKDHEASKDK